MASDSFNATMDKIGHYVEQAAAGNGSIGMLLMAAAEAGTTLADRDTLDALFAAAGNTEATYTNYARKTLATPTRTVEDANDRVLLGGAAVGTAHQITWTSAGDATGTGTNNTLTKVLFYYEPEGTPVDTARLPLMATAISATTDGNDLVLTLHTDGFTRVRKP